MTRTEPRIRNDAGERGRVLLVGLSGADLRMIGQLVEAGYMPNVAGLIKRGFCGNLQVLPPNVAACQWTNIATGCRASSHGILSNVLCDDRQRPRPAGSMDRQRQAIWNILGQAGYRSLVVNWPATHAAESFGGIVVSDLFFAMRGDRAHAPPRTTISPSNLYDSLGELRVAPNELAGEHLLSFVPGAASVNQKEDWRLGHLAVTLAETLSVHAVVTELMEQQPWDFCGVHYDWLNTLGLVFMSHHPPRNRPDMEELFQLYQGVMTAAYAYADLLLGRLLELAGAEARVLVVSDHGFHSGAQRPGAALGERGFRAGHWYRNLGTVIGAGPGMTERLGSATQLDIAPTVLNLQGLPHADDLGGRILWEMQESWEEPEHVPSWEGRVTGAGETPDVGLDEPTRELAIQRLIDIGATSARLLAGGGACARIKDEQDYNLAHVHLEARRFEQAARLLKRLRTTHPEDQRYTLHLARCLNVMGKPQECRELIQELVTSDTPSARVEVILADLYVQESNLDEALVCLFRAEQRAANSADIHRRIGDLYIRLERWNEALEAFQRALDCDPDLAEAWHGQSITHIGRGHYSQAADAALTAIQLKDREPRPHYHLGVALAAMGDNEAAVQAFEAALFRGLHYPAVHDWLAKLHSRSGNQEAAERHATKAQQLQARATLEQSAVLEFQRLREGL